MEPPPLPPDIVVFGPDANCTLALCPIEYSLYKYRPSLPSSIAFIALYAAAAALHAYLGFRWRQHLFAALVLAGCASEIVGYAGRVVMWGNPFSFAGFMTQIIFITSGPVYYTAAIYITLSKTIAHYSPTISRLRPPSLYYYIFIPADILCLTLQAAGGALSTTSSGASQAGVRLALAGLALQVIFIVAFCVLFADHMIRHVLLVSRSAPPPKGGGGAAGTTTPPPPIPARTKIFVAALYTSTLLILARCAFRCYELEEGYSGKAISDEGLFIGLEGVLVVLAVFCLGLGHPGLVFGKEGRGKGKDQSGEKSDATVP